MEAIAAVLKTWRDVVEEIEMLQHSEADDEVRHREDVLIWCDRMIALQVG